MQELSGHGSASSSGEIKDGRSQTVKDSNGSHSPEKHGGSMINDLSKPNIAGSSGSARQSNSSEFLRFGVLFPNLWSSQMTAYFEAEFR